MSRKNPNVEFRKLKKELEKVSNIEDKIKILRELLLLDPSFPPLAKQKREFRRQLDALRSQTRKKTIIHAQNIYSFRRGKYQVCIIGMTNSGKSTLLNKLTRATPKISDRPFTTYHPEIGNMNYEGVNIQLVEIPAIYEGDSERDYRKYEFIRQTDLGLIVINLAEEIDTILLELWNKDIMIGEEGHLKGLVVYRERKPEINIRSEKFNSDLGKAIYEELGVIRVYVDFPKLSHPLTFRRGGISVGRVIELLEKKYKRKFGAPKVHDEKSNEKLVTIDYILNDGEHIKFQNKK